MLKFGSVCLPVILIVSLFISACGGQPRQPSAPTAAQLAETGKTVYATHCAECHGDNEDGITAPAITGVNARLAKYNTGQGLMDYVNTAMPQDNPGSLSQQDYLNVVGYLLVENNFISPGTPLDANRLGNITLK
ncbi:MAG: c-type cytochrome [Dehalococcoidales bacterium]|nr:c-type cytochrome [Dehalococcoidales bacterium]